MGIAKFHTINKEYQRAVDNLTTVTVHYSWFLPGMAEKAKVLMLAGEWENAVEAANKVLEKDNFDIMSICTIIMNYLVNESLPTEAANKLSELIDTLDRMEPKNPDLLFRFARPFARLAGGHSQLLNLTLTLMQRARTINPMSSEYAAEQGYQFRVLGDYARAMECFKEAARLDEANMDAIVGMLHCQILQGKIEDAESQLEFLSVVQQSVGRTPAFAFLDQLLASHRRKSASAQLRLLKEVMTLHWEAVEQGTEKAADVFDVYLAMNPQFLLDVAKQHIKHCGTEPQDPAAPVNPHLTECVNILKYIVERVPGMMEAQLLLATTQYLRRDFTNAVRTLNKVGRVLFFLCACGCSVCVPAYQACYSFGGGGGGGVWRHLPFQCLRIDGSSSDVHLLLAQIALYRDDVRKADQSLQRAVSYKFEVRNSPLYHIVRGRVLELKGKLEEAVALLEKAMKLPGVKTAGGASGSGSGAGAGAGAGSRRGRRNQPAPVDAPRVSLHDRASIWMKVREMGAFTLCVVAMPSLPPPLGGIQLD